MRTQLRNAEQLKERNGNTSVKSALGVLSVPSVPILQNKVKEPNKTGMPDHLKSGIENLSGMSNNLN